MDLRWLKKENFFSENKYWKSGNKIIGVLLYKQEVTDYDVCPRPVNSTHIICHLIIISQDNCMILFPSSLLHLQVSLSFNLSAAPDGMNSFSSKNGADFEIPSPSWSCLSFSEILELVNASSPTSSSFELVLALHSIFDPEKCIAR